VYSIHDPDLDDKADIEEYQETLDPAYLGDVSKLTEIELHNLTVEQRLNLRTKIRSVLRENGFTLQDFLGWSTSDDPDPRFFEINPVLCGYQVRAALRRVGEAKIGMNGTGFVAAEALDLLTSPDVVEEMALYVQTMAHLNPSLDGTKGDSS
jgi:hypothetical protein